MLIFAIAGSGIADEPNIRLAISILLFASSGALSLWLYRRYRDNHKLRNAGVIDADDVGASDQAKES